MTFHRKLIAVLAMLCLFGTQQAAFAHWAAHLGAPAAVSLESQDGDHAAVAALGQSCTSCAAFAGLDAALAGNVPSAAAPFAQVASVLPAPQENAVSAIRRYDSRAPPAVL